MDKETENSIKSDTKKLITAIIMLITFSVGSVILLVMIPW